MHSRPLPTPHPQTPAGVRTGVDLIADGIEDPHNATALVACARMFRARCVFRGGVVTAGGMIVQGGEFTPTTAPSLDELRRTYDLILALEPEPDARDLLRYRPPANARIALVVGNERRGVGPPLRRLADGILRIPTRRHGLASLNVAAAAAIALSQLTLARATGRIAPGKDLAGRRPNILLGDPVDPGQLGSSLRTAWTLGWNRVLLTDARHAWFTTDRSTHAQGRGAARRHKISLRVVSFDPDTLTAGPALVVTPTGDGPSLWRTPLPSKPSLVDLPDDSVGTRSIGSLGLSGPIVPLSLGILASPAPHDHRLITAIVLAEIARRFGWGPA